MECIYEILVERLTMNSERSAKERLTAFLYIMMRDQLPTGIVCATIQASEPNEIGCFEDGYEFTNQHLAALAEDYAGRLLEISSVSEPVVVADCRHIAQIEWRYTLIGKARLNVHVDAFGFCVPI